MSKSGIHLLGFLICEKDARGQPFASTMTQTSFSSSYMVAVQYSVSFILAIYGWLAGFSI